MTPAFEEIPDKMPSLPGHSGEGRAAPRCAELRDGFTWRQLTLAGLAVLAEKVVGGRDLQLGEALALSRVRLPFVAAMVKLRSGERHTPTPEPLPISRVALRPKSLRHIGQPLADWESFCTTLIAIRNEASTGGGAIAWYPILDQPLDGDHGCNGDFTGVEVLRAISLARLLLPAEVEVQAPLAMLGPKLAQVALDFGASHLGYVAVDGDTCDDPLVANSSLFNELLESVSTTEMQ